MLLKLIVINFLKGFGNAFYIVLPYHIKNPYGMVPQVLNRDWRAVSSDIYKTLELQKNKNV